MITYKMITEAQENLVTAWGEAGKRVIEVCAKNSPLNMGAAEFLTHCIACGGNWGGMLLTGIRELRPEVWEAIPDDMGIFAWQGICSTLILCGVNTNEK